MSTLSVPLPVHLETFVENMVKRGVAANKAEVVRQALTHYAEEQAVAAILQAKREAEEGKILRGDIRKIMKQFP